MELLNHRRSLEEIKRRLQNIIELEIEPRLWKIDEELEKTGKEPNFTGRIDTPVETGEMMPNIKKLIDNNFIK